MKWLTLFTAVTLAVCAAYFSIVGLMTIFSGAAISIMVMAGVLEFAKLVSAAWLHYEWDRINLLVRTYFTIAVLVLMFITSMGIFGYLSKAHIETAVSVGGNNELQIQNLERRISYEQKAIDDSEIVLSQLDSTVQTLIDYDRIRGPEGAIATRESQKEERDRLNDSISTALNNIDNLQAELLPLKQQQLELEVEIGPLKYIAELIYGKENARDNFDVAVRGIIILLVVVFDPLAVMLLIVSTGAFKRDKVKIKPLVDENQIMRMDIDGDTSNKPSVRDFTEISESRSRESSGEESIKNNSEPEHEAGDDIHLQSEWDIGIDGSEGPENKLTDVKDDIETGGLKTTLRRRPI